MPSNAEALFQEILSAADKAAHIRGMVNATPLVFEEEWLDFKVGQGGAPNALVSFTNQKIKEIWSESLSGFANTGGGVLIWGVEAKARSYPSDPIKKVDAACGVRLVPNPDALKSQLMALHHMATDPPVIGVRVEPIPDPAGGGFVACLIPESSFKPHRAEMVTNKPYFMRAGDDFLVIPSSILRSLFYPHLTPRYTVQVTLTCSDTPTTQNSSVEVSVELQNVGTATARELVIEIEPGPRDIAWQTGMPWVRLWQEDKYQVQCGFSLHPGTNSPPIKKKFATNQINLRVLGSIFFQMKVFSLDAQPQIFRAAFDNFEIACGKPTTIAATQVIYQ